MLGAGKTKNLWLNGQMDERGPSSGLMARAARALAAIVLAMGLVCALPSPGWAAETIIGDDGNLYYYGAWGHGWVIYGGEITNEDVEIPAEINGTPVKIIWQSAFKGKSNIRSVVIPESIEVLGFYAFKHCTSLEKVTCYGSFSMDKHAFGFCDSLVSFNFLGSMDRLDFTNGDTYSSSAFEESRNVAFYTEEDCETLRNYVDAVMETAAAAGQVYNLNYESGGGGSDESGGGSTEPGGTSEEGGSSGEQSSDSEDDQPAESDDQPTESDEQPIESDDEQSGDSESEQPAGSEGSQGEEADSEDGQQDDSVSGQAGTTDETEGGAASGEDDGAFGQDEQRRSDEGETNDNDAQDTADDAEELLLGEDAESEAEGGVPDDSRGPAAGTLPEDGRYSPDDVVSPEATQLALEGDDSPASAETAESNHGGEAPNASEEATSEGRDAVVSDDSGEGDARPAAMQERMAADAGAVATAPERNPDAQDDGVSRVSSGQGAVAEADGGVAGNLPVGADYYVLKLRGDEAPQATSAETQAVTPLEQQANASYRQLALSFLELFPVLLLVAFFVSLAVRYALFRRSVNQVVSVCPHGSGTRQAG